MSELYNKYGKFWPILSTLDNLLAWLIAFAFTKTELLGNFVNALSNEPGKYALLFSELAGSLRVSVEYVNRSGLVELHLRGFKEYGDAEIVMIIDKFTLKLIKIVTVRGDHHNVVKLTKSMKELLKTSLKFRDVVCHCQ